MPIIVSYITNFFGYPSLTNLYSSSSWAAFCEEYKDSCKQTKVEEPEGSDRPEIASGIEKTGRFTLDDKRALLRAYFFDAFGMFSLTLLPRPLSNSYS